VAEVLVGLDRLSEADDMIQSHLRTNNSDPGLYELAGRIASRRGEHLRSAGYFHKAVLIDHENRRYPELLAREQFHARQYRKCRTTIQSAMQLADYQPPVWMQAMLGDCHMALSAWQEAYSAYQRVCDIQPANADAWCRLAKAALAGNDNTRAIQNAYKARSLQEDHYDATVILALAMIKDKRPDLAARVLSNARTSHPHDSTLRCLLGKAYAAMGKPQQAQECYAVALRLDPENDLARALASGRMGEK
jgi:tetratricopeptide (TPR) repeat protein